MNASGQTEPHGGAGAVPAAADVASGSAAGHPAAEPATTTTLFLGTAFGPGPARTARAEDAEQDREWLEAISRLPATSALLRVGTGEHTARVLLNTDRTTVGRRPGSDIFLDHATVSRAHAVFERRGSEFRVQDLGSLNGTYVNGLDVNAAVLRTGDRIQIGKFSMVFHQNPAEVPPHPSTAEPGPAADPGGHVQPGSARVTSPGTSAPTSGHGGGPALVGRVRSWLAARRRNR
ncbi:MAG TPA: FHA domain-containing protein [Kineosporiaceae bacterium]|nr:FHA domain-containing protein [Kineosporiaceae bacterium]